MTKRLLLLAASVPGLLLGGCSGTKNRGLESVHQPVVQRTDYALDLAVDRGALGRGEGARLAGWLGAMRLGYGDRVAVDDPAGGAGPARREIGALVAGYGLLLAADAPVSPAPVQPGTVRVVVSRMHASVPGCPDWTRDSSVDYEQNTSSNQGCSINSNLAAMVANPADLVRGQPGSGTTDPRASFRAIDAFRKAAPSGAGGTTMKVESAGGK